MKLFGITRFLRFVLAPSALALAVSACKGPDHSPRVVPLNIADKALILPQIGDGPRDENARRELEKQAQRTAAQLFRPEPMARDLPPEASSELPQMPEPPAAARPAWADGVEEPADAGENDLPQSWPIEVRRGETPALLAQWSGQDAKEIVFVNAEALGNRKWLKVGDRISVHMSANRKVAFDRLRDSFQRERVESFFSNRYFKEVVVYRVKKGEFVATAAKRYGDVPLWLIEEFNQIDFRSLQPGDEILIPVVAELPAGMRQPPPLRVVDESGHPLASAQLEALTPRIQTDFMAKARMAIDDSNVFMREGPMPPAGAVPVAQPGYPAPSQGYGLPPARIGHGQAQVAQDPLVAQPAYQPSASPFAAAPAAPQVQPTVAGGLPRDVVVKRGESLMHYVRWSQVPLDAIKVANPHLDPDRIFVGARISLPMSDEQYVEFVTARAAWEKERSEASAADKPAAAKPEKPVKTRSHKVKSGETATSIARAYRIEVKDLRAANPGVDLKRLKVGRELKVPAKKR